MENRTMTAYLFKSGELQALLNGITTERNILSPIPAEAKTDPGKGIDNPSAIILTEEKLKLRENPVFLTAASILCTPQIKITVVKGGGSLGVENFILLGRIDEEKVSWAALLNNESTFAVLYFTDTAEFGEWFVDTFAVKLDIPMKNLLEPDMTLEEWIIAAHTVDAFRRAYMGSMLEYRPSDQYKISVSDFFTSLNESLKSGDIRWLLPAFFAVTPGLAGLKPNLNPEVFKAAESSGLVTHSGNPQTNEGIFAFTAKGMTLGLEFATSWMYGVGFNATVLNDGDSSAIPACFLAPTSLGNHLFTVGKSGTGAVISHFALTHTELDKELAEWLGKVADHAIHVKDRVPSQPAPPLQPSATHFCMKCGNKITPGARFCNKCGNKVA